MDAAHEGFKDSGGQGFKWKDKPFGDAIIVRDY